MPRKVTLLKIQTLSCDGHVVVYQEGILHFNSTLNYYPPFEVVPKKTTQIIRRCRLTLLHTIGILQSDDMLITYILYGLEEKYFYWLMKLDLYQNPFMSPTVSRIKFS